MIGAADITLRDAENHAYFTDVSNARDENGVMVFPLGFADRTDQNYTAGPPVKCVIVLPLSLRDVTVPFELKDIPMKGPLFQ